MNHKTPAISASSSPAPTSPVPPPQVSIVISVYNESEVIQDCLRPFLWQTRRPLEVVLVDNGSTDDTRKKILALEPAFRERGIGLRLFSYGDRYYVAARIHGYAQARGHVIGLIDADTIVADDWIEQVEKTFADADVAGTGGGIRFRNRGRFFNWLTHYFPRVTRRLGLYTFWGLNCAFRKHAYDESGGLDGYEEMRVTARLRTIQDDTYLCRQLMQAGRVVFNPALQGTALFRIQGREPTTPQILHRIGRELVTLWKIRSYFARNGHARPATCDNGVAAVPAETGLRRQP
ncbi:MAG: glycosyltransferase family 2 protein [Verrucomicrobia bacterium]|nr:glycosyltransferase family 2 protein [Verrucomicrobiota bacterium]